MTYKKDTKLTFDVSGVLMPDGQVSIGCQTVPLTDLARVTGCLSVNDKAVRATGIVGTADGDRKVTFEGSDRWFTESQIRDVARNLQAEEPKPVGPAWQDGDSIFDPRDTRNTIVRRGGRWTSSRSSGVPFANNDREVDDWLERYAHEGVVVLVKGGKVVTSGQADDGRIKVGDRVQTVRLTGSASPGSLGTVVATPDEPSGTYTPSGDFIAVKMDGLGSGGYYGNGVYRLSSQAGAPHEYRRVTTTPDPSTLSWQDGDRIRLNRTGTVRQRRDGRWYTDGGSSPNSWRDSDYDEALVGRPDQWTVLRKGGVDLVALAA